MRIIRWLRPAAARLALALAFASTLSAVAAMAQAPDVKVESIAPLVGGRVVFEPKAPRTPSSPQTALLNMDVRLRNNEKKDIELKSIVYQFAYGAGKPAGALLQPVTYTDIKEALTGDESPFIPAGKLRKVMLPSAYLHQYPLPTAVTVELRFAGFAEPINVRAELGGDYQNATPAGSYIFPGMPGDLRGGERWNQREGTDHQFGTAHRTSAEQRHAYDLGVVRWDAEKKEWVRFAGTGKENDDFFVYGKRVRAAAGGKVFYCFRDADENPEPGVIHPDREKWDPNTLEGIPPGGNAVWIDHGNNEFALYAHMQKDSIPLSVCPTNGKQGANPPVVKAGDQLGLAGNSGDSGGPHLHFHVQLGPRGSGEGVPVRFRNLKVSTNTASPDTGWLDVEKRSLPTGPVYVLPLPPSQPPGDKKVAVAEPKHSGQPVKRPAPPSGARP